MQVFNSIKTIFNKAIETFNDRMGTTFSNDNIILQGINEKNKIEVFEKFCSKYFPYRLEDNYKDEDYFDFYASAFVGENNVGVDGILYREDKVESLQSVYHTFLHELAHIFLVRNEFDGKNFYDEYCDGYFTNSIEDGVVNAGYAVWREMAAEIVAIELDDYCFIRRLSEKRQMLNYYSKHLNSVYWKGYLSYILTEIMTSDEVEQKRLWNELEPVLKRFKLFDNLYFLDVVKLVFIQLRTKPFDIDLDFIMELGNISLYIYQDACLRRFGNNILGEK